MPPSTAAPPALARPPPYWERTEDGLRGWITTRPTPLKHAHLEHSPFVSCTYWDATQDTAIAERRADWSEDSACAWDRFRPAPEPLGHDPYAIWPEGPDDPDAGALRLDPWRLKIVTLDPLMGRSPALTWTVPCGGAPRLAR